jgi:hypothetical protein
MTDLSLPMSNDALRWWSDFGCLHSCSTAVRFEGRME